AWPAPAWPPAPGRAWPGPAGGRAASRRPGAAGRPVVGGAIHSHLADPVHPVRDRAARRWAGLPARHQHDPGRRRLSDHLAPAVPDHPGAAGAGPPAAGRRGFGAVGDSPPGPRTGHGGAAADQFRQPQDRPDQHPADPPARRARRTRIHPVTGGQGEGPRGPRSRAVRRPPSAGRARESGPGARGGDARRGRTQRPGPAQRPAPGRRPASDRGGPGAGPMGRAGRDAAPRGSTRAGAGGRGGPGAGGRLRSPAPPGHSPRRRTATRRKPPRRRPATRPPLARGNPARRLRITLLCLGFVLSLVAGRLVQVQAMQGHVYQATADHFRLNTITQPAVRGSISTADGTTLAMTVQDDLIYADPPMILAARKSLASVASALAGPLGMTSEEILAKLVNPTSKQYVVLKQNVPATTADQITALNQPGVVAKPSYTRAYPNSDLAANIVGFTSAGGSGDLSGQAGVEQSYNRLLAGQDGRQEVQDGTNGQPIPVAGQDSRPMIPGHNLRLTVLSSLQWAAERACAQQVKKSQASNCTVVVMQPNGKILAMAQSPSFNPAHTVVAHTADLPVSDVFDP